MTCGWSYRSSAVWSRGKSGQRTVSRGAVVHTLRAGELRHGSWASRRVKKSRAATGAHMWGQGWPGGCGVVRRSAKGDGGACARLRRGER
jgi:hypothetical protein